MREISLEEVEEAAAVAAQRIAIVDDSQRSIINLYGIPRGGAVPVVMVARVLDKITGAIINIVDEPELADYFVDDLVDSGKTRRHYHADFPGIPFVPLFSKGEDLDDWLVFPWEGTEEGSAEDIPIRLLQYLGEDPARGGLLETPKRFLKAWKFFTSGYKQNPKDILKVFEDGAENCDEMVLVKDIPIYSQCEHHLAPFFGVAHIAYIPDGKIVGLSKLSRLADVFARRLQVQERLTNEIAEAMMKHLKPKGVAVVVNCRHMCMESRGIQRHGASTITSSMHGVFRDDDKARAEFMGLIK